MIAYLKRLVIKQVIKIIDQHVKEHRHFQSLNGFYFTYQHKINALNDLKEEIQFKYGLNNG